jgi:hypothetical protein
MNASLRRLPGIVPALVLTATLAAAGASRAAEPEAVATAPAATSGAPPSANAASVADQIDTYLKTSPALALPKDGAAGVTGAEEPRKVHGVVDVAVGTGGYRSAFVQSDIPVGKTGTLSIAVGQAHFDGRSRGGYGGYGGGYVPGDRQTLALGFGIGGAALDPGDARCRRGGEQGFEPGVDPQFDGGRPRGCRAAQAPSAPQ